MEGILCYILIDGFAERAQIKRQHLVMLTRAAYCTKEPLIYDEDHYLAFVVFILSLRLPLRGFEQSFNYFSVKEFTFCKITLATVDNYKRT